MAKIPAGHWAKPTGRANARYHLVIGDRDGAPLIHKTKALTDKGEGFDVVPSPPDPGEACKQCLHTAAEGTPEPG